MESGKVEQGKLAELLQRQRVHCADQRTTNDIF
jgi:hypothetical protein